jgi:hypothetical protein
MLKDTAVTYSYNLPARCDVLVRLLVAFGIVFLADVGFALAEWREVGKDAGNAITTYADPASIRRTGSNASITHLYDFKFVQVTAGKKYSSLRQQRDFECKKQLTRSIQTTAFSGSMGGGSIIVTESNSGEWTQVKPDTPIAYLMYIACTQ